MTQQRPQLKVVDLFSGAGGMSAGFKALGSAFKVVGAVDFERGKPGRGLSKGTSTQCNPTYAANIGVEPLFADLSKLSPNKYRDQLGLAKGELSVLISCAPCTGFSQKNARNHSEDDPRNGLIERTGEFVRAFMPEFLVMENVKELLTGNQSHHFDALRKQLTRLGYDVWAAVHDLSSFQLPQRRTRALVIATRLGKVAPFQPPPGRIGTVRDAIGHLPPIRAGEVHPSDPMHVSPKMTPRVMQRIRAIPLDGGSWSDVMRNPRLSLARKKDLLTPAMFRARPGSFPDVYGRLWWDRPAVTITRECGHSGNGRYLHPAQNRLLTVREMAILQGFPTDYMVTGRLSAKYNQIGDAVPPLISRMIARHIYQMRSSLIADPISSRARNELIPA